MIHLKIVWVKITEGNVGSPVDVVISSFVESDQESVVVTWSIVS